MTQLDLESDSETSSASATTKSTRVMGEFADPARSGRRRPQDPRDGLHQARRHVAVSGARHRRRASAFRIRSSAGS